MPRICACQRKLTRTRGRAERLATHLWWPTAPRLRTLTPSSQTMTSPTRCFGRGKQLGLRVGTAHGSMHALQRGPRGAAFSLLPCSCAWLVTRTAVSTKQTWLVEPPLQAFAYFDKDHDRALTRAEMQSSVLAVFKERKNMAASLEVRRMGRVSCVCAVGVQSRACVCARGCQGQL